MGDEKEANGLLHRIDERTTLLISKFGEMKDEVHDLRRTMNKQFVSQDEFTPVKNVVYGLVTIIMVSVLGAIVSLIVLK